MSTYSKLYRQANGVAAWAVYEKATGRLLMDGIESDGDHDNIVADYTAAPAREANLPAC